MGTQINQQAILAWMQLAQTLASIGVNAAVGIKNAIKSIHADVTDEELDRITNEVINDATRRKLMAEADARGGAPQA